LLFLLWLAIPNIGPYFSTLFADINVIALGIFNLMDWVAVDFPAFVGPVPQPASHATKERMNLSYVCIGVLPVAHGFLSVGSSLGKYAQSVLTLIDSGIRRLV
jgi:hypothetical protein